MSLLSRIRHHAATDPVAYGFLADIAPDFARLADTTGTTPHVVSRDCLRCVEVFDTEPPACCQTIEQAVGMFLSVEHLTCGYSAFVVADATRPMGARGQARPT